MSANAKPQALTGHIITHNHWDRDWVLTEMFTSAQAVEFFSNLFAMMRREPAYRMVLDGQAELIEDFLESLTPEKRKAAERELKYHIKRKRLVAGPTYIQPDYVLISGEAHVRNLLLGHKVALKYGNVMKVGWLVDTFGHISQAPQLLNQFGIDGIFIARGHPIPPEEIMSEFVWSGPDGSELLAVYTMNTSRNAMNLAQMPKIAENRIDIEIEKLSPLCVSPHIPLFNGFEQDTVIDDIWPIIRKINARDKLYKLTQTNPDEFFEVIKPALQGKKLSRCKGFLYSGIYMPLLHGTLSTRMHLKLRNDTCEKLNEKWAEPLSTLAWSRGDKYPAEELERSWKLLLKNDHHDDICGSCSDEVDIDMNKRYDQAERISHKVITDKLTRIACNVDTHPAFKFRYWIIPGISLVVFNPTHLERNDVLRAVVEIPESLKNFKIVGTDGKNVPFQITAVSGESGEKGGSGERTELALKPRIPPSGYTTLSIAPRGRGKLFTLGQPVVVDADRFAAENEYLRIKINPNGSVTVTDKETRKVYREAGVFVDGGDMGDVYDYSSPPVDKLVSSRDCKAGVTVLEAGPLFARFRVEITMQIPASLHKNRKHRTKETVPMPIVSYIELTAGGRRVNWTTSLTNVARNHRLRVHFPTGVKSDRSFAGEAFDVNPFTFIGELWGIPLPKRLEGLVVPGRDTIRIRSYPFHGFCDYSDGKTGVSVLAKGIREYEVTNGRRPGKPAGKREIALTLLRCVGWMTHLDILTRNGDVGWEIYTPMAQCIGTYTFRYGFCPHKSGWFEGGVHLQSELFNEPVRVVETSPHEGSMPWEFSLIEVEPKHKLILSALKRSEDGQAMIVRLYNPRDNRVNAAIRVNAKVKNACLSNAAEDRADKRLKSKGGRYEFVVPKRAIFTLRFELREDKALARKPPAKQVRATRECPSALRRREKCLNLELPPLVVKEEIESENRRLARLRKEYRQLKERARRLKSRIDRAKIEDHDLLIEWSRMNHLVALHRRYVEEAKVSVLMTRRRYYEEHVKDPNRRRRLMEECMKQIGKTKLRQLRIVGRLHEYVRQFYVSRKASRLGRAGGESGESGEKALAREVTAAALGSSAQQSLPSRKRPGHRKKKP